MKLLSIIVPVYNEEANIEPFHAAATAALAPLQGRYDLEFVFTDNCSTDGTWTRLEALRPATPESVSIASPAISAFSVRS